MNERMSVGIFSFVFVSVFVFFFFFFEIFLKEEISIKWIRLEKGLILVLLRHCKGMRVMYCCSTDSWYVCQRRSWQRIL